ncbi:hypothetical protein [Rhodococcoides kyotonense]|uniref:Uncharacterized protein n=1 Tax=Rhodococcoides kyotonense TaxID=398843 RepID=A0A239FD26_9NOCA|nr:hypothetical protein [Rhodococcus kyotonensis]SNS54737.1 hypothetical protein SAMN05421642_103234 [Rhodococcus kyotonensis]
MRMWTEAAAAGATFQAELQEGETPVVLITTEVPQLELMLTMEEVRSLLAAVLPVVGDVMHEQAAGYLAGH